MINACLELKTSCGKCGQPLPINAMVEKVICNSCQNESDFSYEFWNKSLLSSVFEEVGKFKEGEGQPSTMMTGGGTFNIMYGKQNPRCSKCKTSIDMNRIDEFVKNSKAACTKCSNEISVRSIPEAAKELMPRVKYLVGEDKDLFPSGNTSSAKLPNSTRLVVYACPSCAAALEIDGTDRMVKCKSCGSEVYLPDDLWLRLHPVKTIQRWYVCFDGEEAVQKDKLVEWYHLCDVTIDEQGNLYMATLNDDDDRNDTFKVWSFGPDMKTRWERTGLKYHEDGTGITITNDRNLYIWDKFKFSLLKLSAEDGRTLQTIEGNSPTADNPYSFNMKGCDALIQDKDDTIMAFINNEIVRYTPEGKRVSLWGDIREEAKPHGFLSGLANTLAGGSSFNRVPEEEPEWAPYLEELHSHPKRCMTDFFKLNIGWDGFLYVSDRSSNGANVGKYDRSGKLHWKLNLPITGESKACTDSNGNVYVLGRRKDDSGNTNVVRISNDGRHVDVVIKDLLEGGDLEEEDMMAVAQDGTIYVFKFYNRVKVFSPDFKKIYTSEQSQKDDAEALARKKAKVDNDEEK